MMGSSLEYSSSKGRAMPTAITDTSTIVAASGPVSADVDGETVILHLGDGIYYGLDAVGTDIWNHLKTPRQVGELLATLQRDYAVEADRCRREVLALLHELAERGLVEVR
jgi:hypothetical protein